MADLKLTATNIVKAIKRLPENIAYDYISKKKGGQIQVVEIVGAEGPIIIKRSKKGISLANAKPESISPQMIKRVANAFRLHEPVSLDRVLGASYNTRSVLESLLAHSPQFYYCYPGRIDPSSGKVKQGHKHLIWYPDDPHENGIAEERQTQIVISEVAFGEAVYDALTIPEVSNIGIEVERRHTQIQIALIMIGWQLGYRTWIARNDKGIIYDNKRLAELDGVIGSLEDVKLLSNFDEAMRAALLIDCVWFKNGRLMPAVLEIEHSTGVTSGLARMKDFQDKVPPVQTRYVIVAHDDEREKVVREANKAQFRALDARFFSYGAVEELLILCKRRKIRGVTEEFLDCFMEKVVE